MNIFVTKSIYLLIILYCDCVLTDSQRGNCKNENICVPLKQCISTDQKLYKENLAESEIEDLKNLQCGYSNGTVYVCCKSSLPLPPNCGPVFFETRIVGGNIASIYEYPWTVLIGVSIMTDEGETIRYDCGGALINDQYVLTAAHCIKIMSKKNIGQIATKRITQVRLGEWNLQESIDIETNPIDANKTVIADPVLNIKIEKYIVHENYHPQSKFYDIALIKLAEIVNFSRFIKPICLPDKNQIIEDHLTVIGWGRTENETRSTFKRYAVVEKYNFTNCIENYKKEVNIEIDSTQLCAGGTKGIDSCQGDSGGPLVGTNISNPTTIYHYLAGIVSFGVQNCGKGKLPGVYTDVKSYLNWIYENIEHYG